MFTAGRATVDESFIFSSLSKTIYIFWFGQEEENFIYFI